MATAIQDFRKIASRYEVSERWIAAVEDTLCQNLKSWGLLENDADATAWSVNGHAVSYFHLEQQFKGNYLLQATIDGLTS